MPFPDSRNCLLSLDHGPFLYLQSQQYLAKSISSCISLVLPLLPPYSSYKDPCDYTRSTQIFQDHLPAQGQLPSILNSTCNLNSSVPCNLFTGPKDRTGHLWGGGGGIILQTIAPNEIELFQSHFTSGETETSNFTQLSNRSGYEPRPSGCRLHSLNFYMLWPLLCP